MVIRKGRAPLVAGTPAQTARLRPLRNPLYDTERMPTAVAVQRIELFVNRRTFADATVKNLNDTNMEADGVLGLPLEFDLLGLTGKLNMLAGLADVGAVYEEGVLQWFFHQSVPWLQVPITEIPSGVAPYGQTTEATSTIFSNGMPTTTNFFNMTDHLRQARHIVSMESFRGVVQFPAPITPVATIWYKLIMQGILYTAL